MAISLPGSSAGIKGTSTGAIVSPIASGLANSQRDMFGGRQKSESNDQYHNIEAGIEDEYKKLNELNDKAAAHENSYIAAMNPLDTDWASALGKYRDQADIQSRDASVVYNQNILPNATKYLEDAKREADKAMTLQQSQDPNNSIARSFRDFYEKQAQGEGQRGLADSGVLQSLGAQAMQQYSGLPMTGAQMQMAQATAQAQAGQAYANTQKRIQALRDQGIAQGWEQTDKAYNRGQAAKDRFGNSISGLQAIQGNNINQQQALRGEGSEYGQRQRDTTAGMYSRNVSIPMGQIGRQSALISGQAGAKRALYTNDMNSLNAQAAARAQILPQFIGQAMGVGGQIAAASAGAPVAPSAAAAPPPAQPQQAPAQQPYGSYGTYENGVNTRAMGNGR